MTPDQAIYDLDAMLALDGDWIDLQRTKTAAGSLQIAFEVRALAFVRGYKPEELRDGINQQDLMVIMSPTEINRSGWPGPLVEPVAPGDKRLPKKNDRVITERGILTVQAAAGIYMLGTLVRIEAQGRGQG